MGMNSSVRRYTKRLVTDAMTENERNAPGWHLVRLLGRDPMNSEARFLWTVWKRPSRLQDPSVFSAARFRIAARNER